MLFGVCAGIADYFGFDLSATRVIFIIGALFSFPISASYMCCSAFLLPRQARRGDEQAGPLNAACERSSRHARSVRYRFRDLDARLQRLEKYVTSNRFKLDREFRQLRNELPRA